VSTTIAAPASPFKGLAAFEDSELDALFFFGREREREVLVANLVASRLTVLYGESGVGKTSLIAAGVARELRALGPGTVVSVRDTWSGSLEGLFDEVRAAEEAYVILDQFEEYFLYYGDEDGPGTLLHELPELLHGSRVNVLLSLREDALARLDAFKARIPNVFANQVRLDHLDRTAARAAILGPIARWNEVAEESVEIEPALVDAVLDEVAVEGRSQDRERIEAPYLQLVLERLWQAERAAGSRLLRLETLRSLGGAGTIVRDHLLRALDELSAEEQDVAASMFEHLVTPSGTKIAHRAPDLAQYADVPEASLRAVLSTLSRDRIVHSVDGSDRYEIFHDVLAEPISAWRLQRRLERERGLARRRQRRLLVLATLSACALAVVAGLAVWAFVERGSARSQAHHAQARELLATALQQLPIDPNASVRLALGSARLESSRGAENVLRQALLVDRLRLVRHAPGPVRGVAQSPGGDLIAAAVAPNHVLVLDAHDRRLVRTLVTRQGVSDVGFAADGRTLVTVSHYDIAQVWDVATWRPLPRARVVAARAPDGELELVPLQGQLARTIAHARLLRAAPGGRFLAAAVADPGGRVRPWLFANDGRLLHVLPERGIKDMAFSPDGRLLATASADGLTILWNPQTGRNVHTFLDAKSGVNAVAFSPDGTLLATGGQDSAVRIWDVVKRVRRYYLFGHTNPVSTLAWSPDGRVVASASPDRTVLLWRVHGLVGAGSLAATLAGNRAPVRALAFSRDSTALVTGGDDQTIRVWDARPDQQLDLLGRARGSALAARWAGDRIVALWSSGVVRTYDARTRRVTHALLAHHLRPLTSLGVSRDASTIAVGGADGRTNVWDGRTGDRLRSWGGPAPVSAIAVSPGGRFVASGDRRGVVRVWNPRGKDLRWTGSQSGAVRDLAFSPAGDRIVVAGPHGTVIFSAASGRRLHALPSPDGDTRAVFSPDGRLVATAGADSNGRLWFAGTGSLYRRLRGHRRPLTDVAFGDGGRLLATSSEDSDVRIWNVARGGIGHPLQRTAFGPVAAVGFDATGRWVVAAGPISAIVWRVSTGRQLFYLRGHTSLLTGAAFSPRGATIISSSRDGTVRTYTCTLCVDLSGLVHLAEHRLAQTR
jgi:WD40 repeat protein